ncbi:MAG TPA: Gfo/Idh/MocA family oxidoreductase [Acidimicrobiia bacterium]|nr:Gfo/Idh/MocA family oxidoreductase [Acidimicrobiia bacterium]
MKTGLGIIGTGRWAAAHAEAARRSESVQLVACFSRSDERREAFAHQHGLRSCGSLGELLSDREVEAVVISSPNDAHAFHLEAALQAGRPALVDKPMGVGTAEAVAVWRLASKAKVPVGVAHHPRRLAGHRVAKELIESGRLGWVRTAYANFSNARGARLAKDAWHRTARGSEAGVLIQVGIHQVDNLHFLLGPPRQVNARFAYGSEGLGLPDLALVTIVHAGGAMSVVASSWTTPSYYRLDLLATEGNLEYRLDHAGWTTPEIDSGSELIWEQPGRGREVVELVKGDPLREQLEELGAAARHGTPMGVSVVDGLWATVVVEAAVRSAANEGAVVEVTDLLAAAGADLAGLVANSGL